MLRVILLLVLIVVVARAFWSMVDGVIEGVTGRPPQGRRSGGVSRGVPERGVQMVRDPVCRTFVVPEHALSLPDGRIQVFFCSARCRDQYRSRSVEGRTA